MARRSYTPERIINKLREANEGKLLSPSKRRKMVIKVCTSLSVSERRACRVLGQARTTQRHSPHLKDDEERLLVRIIELPNTLW